MSEIAENIESVWKVHTARMFEELISNARIGIFRIPLLTLRGILADVGERAAELNDPQLNALMCRLAIYSCADPDSPDYDPELTKKIITEGTQEARK